MTLKLVFSRPQEPGPRATVVPVPVPVPVPLSREAAARARLRVLRQEVPPYREVPCVECHGVFRSEQFPDGHWEEVCIECHFSKPIPPYREV